MVGDPVTYFCSEILDNYRQFCGDLGIYRQNVYKLSNDNKRNILYAKGIDEIEPTQSAVVLLGAAHFYTEKGVLALLRKHDWTITRFSCPVWSDDTRAQQVASGLLEELQAVCKKVKPMRALEKASKQGLKQEEENPSIEKCREEKTAEPEPKSEVIERLARSQGLKQEDAATGSSRTLHAKETRCEMAMAARREMTIPAGRERAVPAQRERAMPRKSKKFSIRKALSDVTSEELDAANLKHLLKYARRNNISLTKGEFPRDRVAEQIKTRVLSCRAS